MYDYLEFLDCMLFSMVWMEWWQAHLLHTVNLNVEMGELEPLLALRNGEKATNDAVMAQIWLCSDVNAAL